jgi:hypothetical protein
MKAGVRVEVKSERGEWRALWDPESAGMTDSAWTAHAEAL